MTRRLAWAAGASCGLIVGYLYGTVTLDWLSWRAVRRSQPRTPVPGTERRLPGARMAHLWWQKVLGGALDDLAARADRIEARVVTAWYEDPS